MMENLSFYVDIQHFLDVLQHFFTAVLYFTFLFL